MSFLLFSCLRQYKDLAEEKEYLEVSVTNLTSDLEDLKNRNKSLLEKQHSWSTTSSMDYERTTSPMFNSPNNFDENSNSMSYNKASDSVKLHQKSHLRNQYKSSSPVMDVDMRNHHIQTPSGFTPIKQKTMEDENDVITPLATVQQSKNYLQLNSSNSHGKRKLNYGNSGQVGRNTSTSLK